MTNPHQQQVSGSSSRMAAVVICVALISGAASLTASSGAQAARCSTVPGCTNGSTIANKFASTTISTAITAFRLLVEEYLLLVQDAVARLANQGSNNLNNMSKTQSSLLDSYMAQTSALAMGATRMEGVMQMAVSRTACRTDSNSNMATQASYRPAVRATYETSQRDATDYASNAPGGPTARGSLQASQQTFKDIMDGFCDPAVMSPPSGVNCTLSGGDATMAFRYTQPYQAVFGVPNGTISPDKTSAENRAARLFVRMAIEPVPTDPIRGPVLRRSEGQSVYTRRQGDIATINLARGALDRMVDDRIGTAAAGSESVEYLRQRAWADARGMARDGIDRAAQPTSANLDDLAPMVADINKIYLQIYNNLERLAAIKATHLARVVSSGEQVSTGAASRAMGN